MKANITQKGAVGRGWESSSCKNQPRLAKPSSSFSKSCSVASAPKSRTVYISAGQVPKIPRSSACWCSGTRRELFSLYFLQLSYLRAQTKQFQTQIQVMSTPKVYQWISKPGALRNTEIKVRYFSFLTEAKQNCPCCWVILKQTHFSIP